IGAQVARPSARSATLMFPTRSTIRARAPNGARRRCIANRRLARARCATSRKKFFEGSDRINDNPAAGALERWAIAVDTHLFERVLGEPQKFGRLRRSQPRPI